jgi:tRNA-specific 2-thiouridylase
VSAAEPLYVLGSEPRANRVIVGPKAALARTRIGARGRLYVDASRVDAKLRYRSPSVRAEVEASGRGFRLRLDRPAHGVAKGQAAVLYEGDAVVGAGLVTSAVSA